jgi:hypothetical protein
MTDAERIWNAKSDDDLLMAAAELDTYTDEGRRVIRQELRRRGLEDPDDQARFIAPEEDAKPADEEGEFPAPNPKCVRCDVNERYLGARRFRQTADSSALGARGPGFAIDQAFDVYVCPQCGHVDLFVGGAGEGA